MSRMPPREWACMVHQQLGPTASVSVDGGAPDCAAAPMETPARNAIGAEPRRTVGTEDRIAQRSPRSDAQRRDPVRQPHHKVRNGHSPRRPHHFGKERAKTVGWCLVVQMADDLAALEFGFLAVTIRVCISTAVCAAGSGFRRYGAAGVDDGGRVWAWPWRLG